MSKIDNSNKSPFFSFSVKEVIEIFSAIDEQIIQLHKCSSDDFLGLNADFKQYYKQSKVISENANEIFRSLTESGSGDLLRKLEDLYKELKISQTTFSKSLESSVDLLKELISLLDQLFLPIKNLNQDLMTLKFLLANLKISSSSVSMDANKEIEQELINFNKVINDFKTCSFQNETILSGLKDQAKKTLNSFESIRNRSINDLDIILNHLHYGIILFAEKHEESTRQIPQLTQKTENSSKSIADIITNLQYQDIIRQKMEHIQATHKKVLKDLEQHSVNEDDAPNVHQEKLISRIRDIANLQSAQLVHANKEYQQAIEVITGKFLSIGSDMTTISAMCMEFIATRDNSEEFHLKNLLSKIENSANVLSSFLDAGKSFINHLDLLTTGIYNSVKRFSSFSNSLISLKEATNQTLNVFEKNPNRDEQLTESLKQIQSLFSEIEKFEGSIQEVFTQVEKNGLMLSQNIENHLKTVKDKGSFSNSAENLNSISSFLATMNERIQLLLDQNLEISNSISRDVRSSIEKIRYYDFFEKVIVDIINELNQIYKRLKTEENPEDDKKEDLDKIKSLYTMASEHIIHDKITSGQGDVDLFDQDIPKTDEDDDNLELF